jgi:hypothetical protein
LFVDPEIRVVEADLIAVIINRKLDLLSNIDRVFLEFDFEGVLVNFSRKPGPRTL